jgi:hypothetical protein
LAEVDSVGVGGANYRLNMKKNNLIRFAQSLVLLPVITMSFPFSGTSSIEASQNVLVQKVNIEANGMLALNQAGTPEADFISNQITKDKVQREAVSIDDYFAAHNMPLVGTGMIMVREAYLNNLDWRLLPAIAIRESTGGKNACDNVKFNPFGWNSCKTGFNSYEDAIKTVAKNLAGKNPNTANSYTGKTIKQILQAYNPPYVAPKYAGQVMAIMNDLGDADNVTPLLAQANT